MLSPRKENYAPTEIMPLVVGFQNPELAPLLYPSVDFILWDMNNISSPFVNYGFDFKWANLSSCNGTTFYKFHPFPIGLTKESFWMLN